MAGNIQRRDIKRPSRFAAGNAARKPKTKVWKVTDADRWLDQVYADHSLPMAASKVARGIAKSFADWETGEGHPALTTLAADVGCSVRTLQSLIADMKERGHVIVKRGGRGHSNRYLPALFDMQNSAHQVAGLMRKKLPIKQAEHAFETRDFATYLKSVTTNVSEWDRLTADPKYWDEVWAAEKSVTVEPFGLCIIDRVHAGQVFVRSDASGDIIRIDINSIGDLDIESATSLGADFDPWENEHAA